MANPSYIPKLTIPDSKRNYRTALSLETLCDLNLSASELRLYGLIEQMENCTGLVYYSNKTLALYLGVTIRQIQNISKSLQDKKYIKREWRSDSKKYIWRTVKHGGVIKDLHNYDDHGGEVELHGGGEVELHGGGETQVHPSINKTLNTKTTHTSESISYKNNFEEFWSICPKQTKKPAAKKVWDDLSENDHKKAINDYQSRFQGIEKRFITNPENYLANRMWEDEIIKRCGTEIAKEEIKSEKKPIFTPEQLDEISQKERLKMLERVSQNVSRRTNPKIVPNSGTTLINHHARENFSPPVGRHRFNEDRSIAGFIRGYIASQEGVLNGS